MIQEWSGRYGYKVVDWRFDGGYAQQGFDDFLRNLLLLNATVRSSSWSLAVFTVLIPSFETESGLCAIWAATITGMSAFSKLRIFSSRSGLTVSTQN